MLLSLEKILQTQGFGARKQCQALIKNGHVRIDGDYVQDPKEKFDVENLSFYVYEEEFLYREKVYLALYKPEDYECSHRPRQHHSVFDIFPEEVVARGIQCVGRLDQDTTGLLLLSDDGQFLHRLTHPKKHVSKYYIVETADEISDQQLMMLQEGVELDNEKGMFKAKNVTRLAPNQCRFALEQGIYHQVKRMMVAVGNHVVKLHRDQVGLLHLDQLPLEMGDWCYLDENEIARALTAEESESL